MKLAVLLLLCSGELETYQCYPTLVRGEKEVEVALAEGKYPVIDILTDVFAVASAPGTLIVLVRNMYTVCWPVGDY